jgi:flagellar biosynthesis protein FlhG
MRDQAQGLRDLISGRTSETAERSARILTVTSGKGGVGKSNFTLNFALLLRRSGYRVLVFDADIGLANLDVLMGVTPKYNLYHLLKNEKSLKEIVHTGPEGLKFIAGGSGFTELVRLTDAELEQFASQVLQIGSENDFIIFDTGAGLSKETLKFILAAEETFVVTTPEPTAITDAYAIIKMVKNMNHDVKFRLVVNRVANEKEGRQTADKISLVARKFLGLDIPALGFVDDDVHVSRAVRKQVPFTIEYPASAASRSLARIVQSYLEGIGSEQVPQHGSIRGFLHRMRKLLT